MAKKIEYKGIGNWNVQIQLPEQLAQRVLKLLNRKGVSCAELSRTAIADYVDRAKVN